jgi:hypothetical protein
MPGQILGVPALPSRQHNATQGHATAFKMKAGGYAGGFFKPKTPADSQLLEYYASSAGATTNSTNTTTQKHVVHLSPDVKGTTKLTAAQPMILNSHSKTIPRQTQLMVGGLSSHTVNINKQ